MLRFHVPPFTHPLQAHLDIHSYWQEYLQKLQTYMRIGEEFMNNFQSQNTK